MATKGPDDEDDDGDFESSEEFLEKYYHRLRGSAEWMVGDGHLAQDMVQETFLNLWRRYQSRLEDGEELRLSPALAFTALRNTVISYFRKEAAEKRRRDSVEVFAATTTARDPATIVTEDDATRTFFESLGPEQQKITLLFAGGYTPAEIGDILGKAEGTVNNHLTVIRKALKRSFPDALMRLFPPN